MRQFPAAHKEITELLYSSKSLKFASALVIRRNQLSVDSLPEELRMLISSIIPTDSHFEATERSCSQEHVNGMIRIANFGMFPNALLEPQHTPGWLFHTNLLEQARAVLSFLTSASAPDLRFTSPTSIQRVLQYRYPRFLEMQSSLYPEVILAPPQDVALVWFSHMLQSDSYQRFIES